MIWRGVCDDCGHPVIWGGDGSAKPDIPNDGQKVLCLSCYVLEPKGDTGVKSATDTQPVFNERYINV